MKTLVLLICTLTVIAKAQVVPTTPTKFKTRGVGTSTSSTSAVSGGGTATIGVPQQKPDTVVRTTTYLTLTLPRQWTSADGKPLLASLIAFEDMVVETLKSEQPTGGPATTMPKLNGKPTVVKAGKVRLFSNGKPYEVALDKLSQADRDFIDTVKHAVEAKP